MSAGLFDKSRNGDQRRGVFESSECVTASFFEPNMDEPVEYPVLVTLVAWTFFSVREQILHQYEISGEV